MVCFTRWPWECLPATSTTARMWTSFSRTKRDHFLLDRFDQLPGEASARSVHAASIHYVGRLYAVRRTLLETATQGGVVFRHEYDGIEEHDLLLRLALSGAVESRHVPLFLYYPRAESVRLTCLTARELAEKRRSLLEEHAPGPIRA